jgi:hypothetical protein
MKKTAIQLIIKKLEEKRDMWKADGKLSDRQIRGSYVIAILVAKELLEMEKEQIIESCDIGFDIAWKICKQEKSKYKNAEEYYNKTFKNK